MVGAYIGFGVASALIALTAMGAFDIKRQVAVGPGINHLAFGFEVHPETAPTICGLIVLDAQ